MKSQDPPDVIPCEADPDYECVRIGAQESRATIATPPPSGATAPGGPHLCPEGYAPRRRRAPYDLKGKRIVRRPSSQE